MDSLPVCTKIPRRTKGPRRINHEKTSDHNVLYLGASPRASIAIMDASKALAAISGRDFITPDDIKKVAGPILGHRIILTPEREMEGLTAEQVVKQIVESIEIPR